jgi:hypothetical protein
MTDTEQLIHQVARELGIEGVATTAGPTRVAVSFTRKDGSQGGCNIDEGTSFKQIHDILAGEAKSASKAKEAKAKVIAAMELKLKALKDEQ